MKLKINPILATSGVILCSIFSISSVAQSHHLTKAIANESMIQQPMPQLGKGQSVKVHMIATEMAFITSTRVVPAGSVEFIVSNQGDMPHEMVVLKITQPLKSLPLKGNRLDEAKAGTKIGEIESDVLVSGATKKLMAKLTPGKYLLVCNIPGHYQAGMRTVLTVK